MEDIDRWEVEIPFCSILLPETFNCHAIGSSEGHFLPKTLFGVGCVSFLTRINYIRVLRSQFYHLVTCV